MKKTQDLRIAIIGSGYRPGVTRSLVRNCVSTLKKHRIAKKQISIMHVPGALEIPLLAKRLAKKKAYDAIIVFGAVVRGNTYHFEQVANECVRGCMQVAYDYEIPVVFEVLCVYDLKDALARARGNKDNRGVEGARTALGMIRLLKTV